VGLFTVELEVGRETRAMIERIAGDTRAMVERIATTAAVELELGSKTREVIADLFESSGDRSAREKIGGLLGKATSDG
jgi:hypothetical protein